MMRVAGARSRTGGKGTGGGVAGRGQFMEMGRKAMAVGTDLVNRSVAGV